MSIWLPESFVDMSTMREIDDTEECWADAGVRVYNVSLLCAPEKCAPEKWHSAIRSLTQSGGR